MNKIDKINIKGYFENLNTNLSFQEIPNQKHSLNINFNYLEQLFTIWKNEFSNINKINSNDNSKTILEKKYRMQMTSYKLIQVVKKSLDIILESLNELDSSDPPKSLETKMKNNFSENDNVVLYDNILQILEEISNLIKPNIKKNVDKKKDSSFDYIPGNLTGYLIVKEGENITEEELNYILTNTSDSIFLDEEYKPLDRTILPESPDFEKQFEKLFNLNKYIGNIKGTYKLINKILESGKFNSAFLIEKNPPRKETHERGHFMDFLDYDSKYLNFINDLIIIQFKYRPVFYKKNIKVVPIEEKSKATDFYLTNEIFTQDQVDKYQDLVKKFYKAKISEDLKDQYQINYLKYLNAKTTNNYDPLYVDRLRTRQSGSQTYNNEKNAEEETKNKFREIINDLNEIEKTHNEINSLSLDQAKKIEENILQIFLQESVQKNFKKFLNTQSGDKKTSTQEKQLSAESKVLQSFITILNSLNLTSFKWTKINNEALRFLRDYFSFNSLNEISRNSYILGVNLNLKVLIVYNYVRYLINFISNDPSIMNVKDYQYNISENIKNSTEKNILLPPFISSDNDKKNCCFILVDYNDINKFNKKYPDITNKEIFTNQNYLDKLITMIGSKNSNVEYKYKNPDSFLNDLKLLNEIYFSPHPLKNMFNKHFHKNNEIVYKGKSYAILDYKLSPKKELNGTETPGKLPNVKNFDNIETTKDGKQISERTYTIKLDITVNHSDLSVNLINTVKASCPKKAKELKEKYGDIVKKIPGFKSLFEKEHISDRWHIHKGKLRRKGYIESGGSKKKYHYKYMGKGKTQKKKKLKKHSTFKFVNKKLKSPKKTKRKHKRKHKRKAGMETAPTYTEEEYREKKNSPTGSTSPNPRPPSPDPVLPILGRPIQRQRAAVSPNSPPNLRRGRSWSLAREYGPRDFYENSEGEHLDPEAEDDETIYGEMGCWGCDHGSTFTEEHCSQCRNDRRSRRRRR